LNFRYPIFLDLSGKRCLVIGEGYEVASKIRALLHASAQVIYVNRRAEPEIAQLSSAGLVTWLARDFKEGDLDGCLLVIADLADNSAVFRLCEERGILCNSVDDPEHCRFSFGSIHRRGDLTIAISTNGWAPAIAVRLKEKLQREIGPEFQVFLDMLKDVRPEITRRVPEFGARKALWYRIVDSQLLDLLREGRQQEAERVLRQMIEDAVNSTSHFDISGDGGGQ
jgi:siroheme synthase-like protein